MDGQLSYTASWPDRQKIYQEYRKSFKKLIATSKNGKPQID
jgi:hypothetical protein